MNLGQLFEVVLQEGDLLLLHQRATRSGRIIRLFTNHNLLEAVLKVLHKEFSQIKQRLQLLGHSFLETLQVLLRLVTYLTQNFGVDPDVTWLLDNRTILILPEANPDGYYQVYSNGVYSCEPCHDYCGLCYGSSNDECYTCV